MIKKIAIIAILGLCSSAFAADSIKSEKVVAQKASKRILGKWKIDADATISALEKRTGRVMSEQYQQKIKARFAKMSYEITSTKFIDFQSDGKKIIQLYKVLSEKANEVELEIENDDKKGKTIKPVLKFKDNNLLLTLNGKVSMVLKR